MRMGLRFPIFESGFEQRPVWNLGHAFPVFAQML